MLMLAKFFSGRTWSNGWRHKVSNSLYGERGILLCFEGFHCPIWSPFMGMLLCFWTLCFPTVRHQVVWIALIMHVILRIYLHWSAIITQKALVTAQGKEGLITELRKELNVTDTEHGELLLQINSDKSIKMIRSL